MAHLIDDETVAKMGHPGSWLIYMWATRPICYFETHFESARTTEVSTWRSGMAQ
jgi:hypothetical protein